jgi:hypothetical protein
MDGRLIPLKADAKATSATIADSWCRVFAIRNIPKGTYIFPDDDEELVWIDKRDRYIDFVAPLRSSLHKYCRRLTGNLWDAEDPIQDMLLRAFGTLGCLHDSVHSPVLTVP